MLRQTKHPFWRKAADAIPPDFDKAKHRYLMKMTEREWEFCKITAASLNPPISVNQFLRWLVNRRMQEREDAEKYGYSRASELDL